MINIVSGMTPSEFIIALNKNFAMVSGCAVLSASSTITDINNNINIIKAAYPAISETNIASGIFGNVFANSFNQNFTNTIPATWWNNSWLYRNVLYFDASTISADVTNFAIRVRIDKTKFDYSKIKANGADIRFVDKDGTTLDYEIEYWIDTAGSEDAVCWVSVPKIDGLSTYTDIIYVYYGNSSATDNQNTASVWTKAGAIGVWHFADGAGSTIKESTSTVATGTVKNALIPISSPTWSTEDNTSSLELNHGLSGSVDPVNGAEYINCGSPVAIIHQTGNLTCSCRYKIKSYNSNLLDMDLINTNLSLPDNYGMNFNMIIAADSDARPYLMLGDGVPEGVGRTDEWILIEWPVTAMPINIWHNFIGTLSGNDMKAFMDSVMSASTQQFNANTGAVRQQGLYLNLGGWGDGFNRPFIGLIDEIKIFNKALSTDEIILDTANFADTAILIGAEESI